jgi:hypothetical protein
MQTDDTLIVSNKKFDQKEEAERKKAGFLAKPKERLSQGKELIFNGCILRQLAKGRLSITQKEQGKKITLVDTRGKGDSPREAYVQQRARGAYIASICQPEAAFDLSTAAQHQAPEDKDFSALNKRLQWQVDNQDRGLTYLPLPLQSAKLYVFVDGSFANNKDLSSQIGFVIVLGTEES